MLSAQSKQVDRAIAALRADIGTALTKATRSGLSHADAVLVAMDAFNAELRQRLGDGWARMLVGVLNDEPDAG